MAPVTNGAVDFHVEDGRLAMNLSSGANIYLDTPDTQPLSQGEPHATLKIVSHVQPDAVTTVELDAIQLEELQTALAEATEDSDD